jgi:hypothetical protein
MSISSDVKDTEQQESLPEYDDRDRLLSKLSDVIDKVYHKTMHGRVTKNDKHRVQWYRTYGFLVKIYNEVKKDSDLERIEEEIKELKELYEKDR